ncbi:MAG: prephenate dehydratase [Candidatus Nephrothrix sp. EaCA]|nr:MAG: prephenate dehydratase [Candidatus Nephrothrix sp. EaCA]
MAKQKTVKVGIQGIATSFHEVAAQRYFTQAIEIVECLNFHQLCVALDEGKCDYAVMAIENTIAGSILPNYFLLEEFHFSITGEVYLPIHLHLLALPGVKLKDIKTIESHPIAIRQCADYLTRFKDAAVREGADTALTARKVAEQKLTDTAAIANESAAKKFGLEIIDRRIETHKKNFTRFLILEKGESSAEGANKASMCFEVSNKPGSLADLLAILKAHHLNMSKIQSIPVIGKPSQYSIHIDLEWKARKDYDQALRLMLRKVKNLSVLGEYKKGKIEY